VKLLIETGDDFVIGNITGPQNALNMSGSVGKGKDATMTLNARAQIDPDTLKAIVTEAISKACGINLTPEFIAMKCLKPGRPNPTHRYDHVV
jgi:hypothetical protein